MVYEGRGRSYHPTLSSKQLNGDAAEEDQALHIIDDRGRSYRHSIFKAKVKQLNGDVAEKDQALHIVADPSSRKPIWTGHLEGVLLTSYLNPAI